MRMRINFLKEKMVELLTSQLHWRTELW